MKKNINNIIATDLKNLEESLSKSISSEISFKEFRRISFKINKL